jgi:tRNA nucleotidyltransferase (CCA-adding enzyme)
MPDYIYLLANRLSPSQQSALQSIREAAREAGMTVFLTGGAVRDLTSGSPVRDLDVSVQGNALALKPKLKSSGAVLWGEHVPSRTVFARFPGSVRVEISSTRREEFPKPGKPVYHPANILEDLRRRDFTANAMALSLNEGSYGLLMDPLNGVADLEARLLRLVSNYGFLEDPIRLVRAVRLQARMGWELEEKTRVRFENAKAEGVISQISAHQQGYEVEEIMHEEDGLKILKALEADGWMKALFPPWTSAKVDAEALEALREVLVQLQMQGVNPDPSAAQAQLLTAKLPAKDLANLKKLFVRQGFVKEWETQEDRAKEVGKRLTGKEAATPSTSWKLLTSADPEALLWLGLTSKSAPVQEKLKDFFTVWPEARQRIPYALMQEMRIVPELPGYQELVKSIFFELIDGKLATEEEMRQFLEPHSPPAPPPPVTIRRPRAKKSAGKSIETRDEDDEASARPARDDEDGDDADEEIDSADERSELIARSAAPILPPPVAPPPVIPPEPEAAAAPAAKRIGGAPASKPATPKVGEPKVEPKLAPKVPVAAKAAQAAKKHAPVPVKATGKPVGKAPVAASPRNVIKSAPTKPPAKTSAKVAIKSASKKAPKANPVKKAVAQKTVTKPAVKVKPIPKKAAVKPAALTRLRKVVTKPKPAKAIAKAKPSATKSRPAVKAKAAAKGAKSPARSAAAKKKR